MATRSSINTRAKRAETRVARYLWGPDACRDWKEVHDLSGPDADGRLWIGEVKSHTWPAGPRALWTKLSAAFAQALGYAERCFAVLVPAGASIADGLVMYAVGGRPVVVTLAQFRSDVLGVAPQGTPEGDGQDV
jgi:hypothetical protein